VHNVDLTLVAQRPRLAAYIPAMGELLGQDLRIAPERVNVKATTTEGMGFTGRGEGIAAYAVTLLEEQEPGS
jgi:2-C-methyl-D-erythritol 2,4-cyclodiphosphate synthase